MMNGEDGLLSSGEIARNISSCKFVKAIDFDLDGDLDLIVDHKYFERISDVQVEERQGARREPIQTGLPITSNQTHPKSLLRR